MLVIVLGDCRVAKPPRCGQEGIAGLQSVPAVSGKGLQGCKVSLPWAGRDCRVAKCPCRGREGIAELQCIPTVSGKLKTSCDGWLKMRL